MAAFTNFKKFLAGSMKNKLHNLIRLTYFLPHSKLIRSSQINEDFQNLNTQRTENSNLKSQYDEISLKFVKKVKAGPMSATDTSSSSVKYEWSEASRVEGTPCDRICKGKKKIIIKLICTRDKKRVSESLCPVGRSSVQYGEETCNNDCDLK